MKKTETTVSSRSCPLSGLHETIICEFYCTVEEARKCYDDRLFTYGNEQFAFLRFNARQGATHCYMKAQKVVS